MKRFKVWMLTILAAFAMQQAMAQTTQEGAQLGAIFQRGIDAVEQGRYDDAIKQGESFKAAVGQTMGAGSPNEAYGDLLIAMGHSYQQRSAEAARAGERAYRSFLMTLGPSDVNTQSSGILLAGDLAKSGALPAARTLLDTLEKQGVARGPAASDYFLSRSVVARFSKDYPAAEQAAREALRLTIAKSGEQSDETASRLFVLAQVLAAQPAKSAEATKTLERARSLAARTYGEQHPRTREMNAYRIGAGRS